jgi:hypothetical protein
VAIASPHLEKRALAEVDHPQKQSKPLTGLGLSRFWQRLACGFQGRQRLVSLSVPDSFSLLIEFSIFFLRMSFGLRCLHRASAAQNVSV